MRPELPPSGVADHVRFGGPERETFAAAQRRRPGRLALWSGSVLARYRHRYADALVSEASAAGRRANRRVEPGHVDRE